MSNLDSFAYHAVKRHAQEIVKKQKTSWNHDQASNKTVKMLNQELEQASAHIFTCLTKQT